MIKIDRTCRYGHGSLKLTPETWGLPCFLVDEEAVNIGTKPNEVIFTLRLFVCTTCGYLEMADGDLK